jgi:uncharacterized membrane protein
LLAANVWLLFASLIRLLAGNALSEPKLILQVAKWILPVTHWTSPVTQWTPPVTRLRITSQFANAIVMRVRPHYPTVRALRGNLAAGRLTLLVLGYCEA